jgi:hypothetical protein
VNVVTGCCLFTDRAVRLAGDGDRTSSCLTPSSAPIDSPVRRIESSSRLTLYELESACRLPLLAADLVALLPPEMPVTVTIDVPRVQYYVYLLDAFHRGLVAPELMLRWFELVDERHGRVTALLESELGSALSAVIPGRHVMVRPAEGMARLEHAIRRAVHSRTPLAVADMAAELSANDALWAMAIGHTTPAGYRDLVNLSYVVEQLRGGITRPGEHPSLGVAIDNPSERRACAQARTIARRVNNDAQSGLGISLLGLHPLERVFTSEATGPSDPYYHDPGHLFVDSDGYHYCTEELLAILYPGRSGLRDASADSAGPPQRLSDPPQTRGRSARARIGGPAELAPMTGSGRCGGRRSST